MLTLVLGAMRSGKSQFLYHKALESHNAAFVRPKADTRAFLSRGVASVSQNLIVINEEADLSGYKNLFIDEIHLYAEEFIDEILELAWDKNIICAGLLYDYANKPFNIIGEIETHRVCQEIKVFYAICEQCGKKKAVYNIGDGSIGDNYLVLCGQCLDTLKH
ncbi:hypothetical protein [uncultured Helicobacter sp.]|uniref:hypothetical protein n=1 Tax=uncultured Helicobacter sp. TaxID=175537 RepID=UPI00375253E9